MSKPINAEIDNPSCIPANRNGMSRVKIASNTEQVHWYYWYDEEVAKRIVEHINAFDLDSEAGEWSTKIYEGGPGHPAWHLYFGGNKIAKVWSASQAENLVSKLNRDHNRKPTAKSIRSANGLGVAIELLKAFKRVKALLLPYSAEIKDLGDACTDIANGIVFAEVQLAHPDSDAKPAFDPAKVEKLMSIGQEILDGGWVLDSAGIDGLRAIIADLKGSNHDSDTE